MSSTGSSSVGRSPTKAVSTPALGPQPGLTYLACPVGQWRSGQVAEWAASAGVSEQTARLLREKHVDGSALLLTDAAKLKVIIMVNQCMSPSAC